MSAFASIFWLLHGGIRCRPAIVSNASSRPWCAVAPLPHVPIAAWSPYLQLSCHGHCTVRCRQNLGFALQGGLPGINGRGLGYNVAAAESQRTIRALQPVRASKRDHTFETWTPNVCETQDFKIVSSLYFSLFSVLQSCKSYREIPPDRGYRHNRITPPNHLPIKLPAAEYKYAYNKY